MNASLDIRLTKAEFYRWLEGQDRRYELVGGRPVMMTNVSRAHWYVTQRLLTFFIDQIDRTRIVAGPTDLAVEIEDDVRFPDLLIEAAGGGLEGYGTASPLLLVEVLSPSSVGRDMTIKRKEYGTLASLEIYLVASQDEPIVWLWQRPDSAEGARAPFPVMPEEIAGRDQLIKLRHFGLELPLAGIYAGIGSMP